MNNYKTNIKASGLSIYEPIAKSNEKLYIPTDELQKILSSELVGLSLAGLPLRTRSKVVKEKICEALGYPIPKSFKKTQPRFLGQNFDVYTQKSRNVQIWNEPIDPERRYVFLRCTESDLIDKVKIITGAILATFDNTGTLTTKYQATMTSRDSSQLFSSSDTKNLTAWTENDEPVLIEVNPNSKPQKDKLMKIASVYAKLLPLVGKRIKYLDAVQERNRGAELHKLICKSLGYSNFEDDGSYPDLANQLLEIKLQTSPTIDLGLHSPEDGADIIVSEGKTFHSEDIRYVIFDGEVDHDEILLKYLYLVNGKDFPTHFPLFKGKKQNAKLQLPLPLDFWND